MPRLRQYPGGLTLSGSQDVANALRIGAHRVSLLRRFQGGPKGGLNFRVAPKGLELSHIFK